ncbi:hypothetical protein NC652_021080 [Populus alba x Populus x berolinensis]|nr:hypothetical protein NC652_021080 [Populus alba x Populus x berolinensis]
MEERFDMNLYTICLHDTSVFVNPKFCTFCPFVPASVQILARKATPLLSFLLFSVVSHPLSLKPQQQIEEEKEKSCTRCSREFEAMEKALTKVNSLKVGSLWISKKAKEEFSNITEDINVSDACDFGVMWVDWRTISNTVEEKARWVFNKLKGKPLKSLPDLLREYNLPPGLFPQNITCYEFDESKAKLIVYLSSACEVSFKDSSVIRYAPRVKTTLARGKLTGIEGMKTKVLVWVKVTSVAVESYKSDKVWFTAGVKKSRPKIAYDVPQAAIRVEEF